METHGPKGFRYDPEPLAAERRRRGITQAEIAKRIGYSRQQVNLAENGSSASFTLIQRLCRELAVPIGEIVPDLDAVA